MYNCIYNTKFFVLGQIDIAWIISIWICETWAFLACLTYHWIFMFESCISTFWKSLFHMANEASIWRWIAWFSLVFPFHCSTNLEVHFCWTKHCRLRNNYIKVSYSKPSSSKRNRTRPFSMFKSAKVLLKYQIYGEVCYFRSYISIISSTMAWLEAWQVYHQ